MIRPALRSFSFLSLIALPSFSQFTMCSLLPYHLRNSPPLLYGNHFLPDSDADILSLKPNPTFWKEASNHSRTNISFAAVTNPCRAIVTSDIDRLEEKMLRNSGLTQYDIGLPGIPSRSCPLNMWKFLSLFVIASFSSTSFSRSEVPSTNLTAQLNYCFGIAFFTTKATVVTISPPILSKPRGPMWAIF